MTQRWLMVLVLASAATLGAAGAADAAAAEAEPSDLAARLEQARAQLDAAARRLAEVHQELWKQETSGARARTPMLGVLLDDEGAEEGVLVAGVTPGGGAEQAGLRSGDQIVALNGVEVTSGAAKERVKAFEEVLHRASAGDAVAVTFVRDGQRMQADVVTQPRGQYMSKVIEEKQPWLENLESLAELSNLEALTRLETLDVLDDLDPAELHDRLVRVPEGVRLEPMGPKLGAYFEVDGGILVLEAPERAPGLEPGDVLLEVNGTAPAGVDEAYARLGELAEPATVRVKRAGEVLALELDGRALNARQTVRLGQGREPVQTAGGG